MPVEMHRVRSIPDIGGVDADRRMTREVVDIPIVRKG